MEILEHRLSQKRSRQLSWGKESHYTHHCHKNGSLRSHHLPSIQACPTHNLHANNDQSQIHVETNILESRRQGVHYRGSALSEMEFCHRSDIQDDRHLHYTQATLHLCGPM